MVRSSIRWRLALSYAAIALLATLALGAVLLLTLRGYYRRVERDYMMSNAQAIGFGLAHLLEENPDPEALQPELDGLSILSDASVQLYDAEEQLVAASDPRRRIAIALAERLGEAWPLDGRLIALIGSGEVTSTTVPTEGGAVVWLPGDLAQRRPALEAWLPARIQPEEEAGRPMAGAASTAGGSRSDQVVRVPIRGSGDQLLGYVELSNGPAYARQIVEEVAWGLGVAGLVAVALGALVGWTISRRISGPLVALTGVAAAMAKGDFAARADVARRDELGTLARSFNQMADQVEQILATLRRFVSDAAHEIHTPLTALRTNLELARPNTQPEGDDYVARAQAQVERLEALTGGLLDLSRLDSPAQASRLVPVPLLPLLCQVTELYASRAEQAGLGFELSLPETPMSVLGEEAQLTAALSNLLENAIIFTPEGGRIWLGCCQKGGAAVLWVEDTGIGLPEADLPHLFERFFRGSNAAGYPGNGLGLAIVKAAVERHGGWVRAERTEQGSRFSIGFPAI